MEMLNGPQGDVAFLLTIEGENPGSCSPCLGSLNVLAESGLVAGIRFRALS